MNGSFGISVSHNLDRVEAQIRNLESRVVDKATIRALNRALDQTTTQASREIRKVYNVKHAVIMKAMKKIRAAGNRHTAILRIQGARLPLIAFAARWKPGQRGGATVQIKVGGGRKVVRGAFIAATKRNNATGGGAAGMLQVYRRDGKDRYPIKTLRSISVPSAFANEIVLAAVKKIASESFSKNLAQQLKFLGSL